MYFRFQTCTRLSKYQQCLKNISDRKYGRLPLTLRQNDRLMYCICNLVPTQDTDCENTAHTGLYWAAQPGDKPTALSPKYTYN